MSSAGTLQQTLDTAALPAQATIATAAPPRSAAVDLRVAALRRFAVAITTLTVLGHLVLGFEASWGYLLAALGGTYGTEITIEILDAWGQGRPCRMRGGVTTVVDFLLPAHITGLAVAMLLYPGERLELILFAAVVAVASKRLVRVRVGSRLRHVLNPSNTGIAVTLLSFPSVGIAPPYQFTAEIGGAWDWMLPVLLVAAGTFLNGRFTRRLPLISAWLLAFAAQALFRHLLLDARLAAALAPMTGMAFLLFTFYMVSDPGTTPHGRREQVVFGAAVAFVYGALMALHVVFGLFFALLIVCAARGAILQMKGADR